MSPSPVREMSAEESTETTCGVARTTFCWRRPVTTMSRAAGAPSVEISTCSSPWAAADRSAGWSAGAGAAACASSAAGDISAVERRRMRPRARGLFMVGPRSNVRTGGERLRDRRPYRRSSAGQFGIAVQAPLVLPNDAVEELQVQPAYQVSVASRTAPMYDVVTKKLPSVLASNGVTAASLAPLM